MGFDIAQIFIFNVQKIGPGWLGCEKGSDENEGVGSSKQDSGEDEAGGCPNLFWWGSLIFLMIFDYDDDYVGSSKQDPGVKIRPIFLWF